MSPSNADRYSEARQYFLEACDLGDTERASFLERLWQEDPDLAARVETLLSQNRETWDDEGASPDGHRSPDSNEPDQVGPYKLVRELGRGGQGVVYLAEDTRLHRKVALKVLQSGAALTDEALRRFRREAEAASRLEHPGICPVYEAASDGRTPYIAMRYIEGESLASKIASARQHGVESSETTCVHLSEIPEPSSKPRASEVDPSPTPTGPTTRAEVLRVVALIEMAARAIHSAHEAGVIHRDIKPGNIMVTPEGEAIVMDFGLAHLEDEQLVTLTRTGDFFGTPAYMSPEQLLAHRVQLDRRTDIWSLGVMLYECVTLSRPFDAPTREAVYQAIQTRDPVDPRRVNRSIPDDLRVVIQTALEKDRDHRYQTALDLAEDLRRVRMFEPILARPAGPIVRTVRWAQRRPALAASLATIIVLLGAGLSVTTYLYRESAAAGVEKDRANVDLKQARDDAVQALQREQDAIRTERTALEEKKLALEALELQTSRRRRVATVVEEKEQKLREWASQEQSSRDTHSAIQRGLIEDIARITREVETLVGTAVLGDPAIASKLLARFDHLANHYRTHGDQEALAAILVRKADLLTAGGRFREVIGALDAALQAAEATRDKRTIGHALLKRAIALASSGETDRARSDLERAGSSLPSWDAHGKAEVRLAEGSMLIDDGAYSEAVLKIDDAAGILADSGASRLKARVHVAKARALDCLGRVSEALSECDLAAQSAPSVLDANELANFAVEAAEIRRRNGRAHEALERFLVAERDFEALGDPVGVRRSRLGVVATLAGSGRCLEAERMGPSLEPTALPAGGHRPAVEYVRMLVAAGRNDDAIAFLDRSISPSAPLSRGWLERTKGDVLALSGRFSDAAAAYARAEALFAARKLALPRAVATMLRARALALAPDPKAARDVLDAANAVPSAGPDARSALAEEVRGLIDLARGRTGPGTGSLDAAARRFEQLGLFRQSGDVRSQAGSTLLAAGRPAEALRSFSAAAVDYDRFLGSGAAAAYLDDADPARWPSLQRGAAEAFRASLALKESADVADLAKVLRVAATLAVSETLTARAPSPAGEGDRAVWSKIQGLAAGVIVDPKTEPRRWFETRMVLGDHLRESNPALAQALFPRTTTQAAVQSRMPDAVALLEYAADETDVFALVTTRNATVPVRLCGTPDLVAADEAAVRALDSADPVSSRDSLRALGRLLVDPILGHAGLATSLTRLMVVPTFLPLRVPLDCLLTEDSSANDPNAWPWLWARFDVRYLTSVGRSGSPVTRPTPDASRVFLGNFRGRGIRSELTRFDDAGDGGTRAVPTTRPDSAPVSSPTSWTPPFIRDRDLTSRAALLVPEDPIAARTVAESAVLVRALHAAGAHTVVILGSDDDHPGAASDLASRPSTPEATPSVLRDLRRSALGRGDLLAACSSTLWVACLFP